MQLRLLCNLFDGMVAIEGGFKTKSGEVFNELPDRFSDAFVFVGAGYAAGREFPFLPMFGWLCALLAVTTAYVRAMGAAAGSSQHFCGPMAKQQRMAVMTVAAVIAGAAPWVSQLRWVLPVALGVVALGSLITVFRRTSRVIHELEANDRHASHRDGASVVRRAGPIGRDRPPDPRPRIYFANHTSNLDALVIWATLPRELRALTRPVAAGTTGRRARCAGIWR